MHKGCLLFMPFSGLLHFQIVVASELFDAELNNVIIMNGCRVAKLRPGPIFDIIFYGLKCLLAVTELPQEDVMTYAAEVVETFSTVSRTTCSACGKYN